MSNEEKELESTPSAKLRILWWANAPWAPTGYGMGTAGVVPRIKHRYDMRVLCFWGLDGKAFYMNDILCYPKMFSDIGEDAANLIATNWNPHFMITFFDVWIAAMKQSKNPAGNIFLDACERWVPWIPVDHDPSPMGITDEARKAYHAVTMSKFGKEALDKEGVENTLIPLGVDTSVFQPTKTKTEDREWLMKQSVPMTKENAVEWNPEDFIVGVNAAPKDPVRKNFAGMMDAFKIFLEQNPDARKDARLFLHTWKNFPTGWPLGLLGQQRGIDQYCRFTHPYAMYCGLNQASMATMTRSWDVLFNIATREGFGMTIIEACASGVPPIVTDYTSMPELARGHGWVVDYIDTNLTNLLSYGAKADVFEAADAIAEAYNNPDKVKKFGEKARKFSLDYDWEIIAELWCHLIDRLSEDVVWTPPEKRRLA